MPSYEPWESREGGSQIAVSNLNNAHVTCPCCYIITIFCVKFKKNTCRMSLLSFYPCHFATSLCRLLNLRNVQVLLLRLHVACRFYILCRLVNFRGLEPYPIKDSMSYVDIWLRHPSLYRCLVSGSRKRI